MEGTPKITPRAAAIKKTAAAATAIPIISVSPSSKIARVK